MRTLGLALGVVVSSCATVESLKQRAAFDLQCDEGKLQLVELGASTYGVAGCGKRATYVASRDQNNMGVWVSNSPIDSTVSVPPSRDAGQ